MGRCEPCQVRKEAALSGCVPCAAVQPGRGLVPAGDCGPSGIFSRGLFFAEKGQLLFVCPGAFYAGRNQTAKAPEGI